MTLMNLDALIRESWRIYEEAATNEFVVTPSIPIVFFGDSRKYLRSEIKIVTVGLNPSKNEFPENDRFQRFPNARGIYPDILDGKHFDEYLTALNGYFVEKPYKRWFDSYEPILSGLGSSFYGLHSNVALHTDLCSPLATNPTWSKLTDRQKERLENNGNMLWRNLIRILCPDVILLSVASKYLENIGSINKWKVIHTIERENPYEVKLSKVRIGGKISRVVFGKAANQPFGTVSTKDKKNIGSKIRRYVYV